MTTAQDKFIYTSLASGIRMDGRQFTDSCAIEIDMDSNLSAHSSAHAARGDSELTVTIKCELVSEPTSCGIFFRSENALIESLLSELLQFTSPKSFDSLRIYHTNRGFLGWSVHIDITIEQDDGGIIDLSLLAVNKSAVSLHLPQIVVIEDDENPKEYKIELISSNFLSTNIPTLSQIPIFNTYAVTLAAVTSDSSVTNDYTLLLDPSLNEESVLSTPHQKLSISPSSVMVFFVLNNQIVMSRKLGKSLIDPDIIHSLSAFAINAVKNRYLVS
jgi:exosome complex RNA-binding protein Rrp42 (RNase PH superfamily)